MYSFQLLPPRVLLFCCSLLLLSGAAFSQSAKLDDDGDGVVNAEDCAPLDSSRSTLHTYALTSEVDESNAAAASYTVCTEASPPKTLPWGVGLVSATNPAQVQFQLEPFVDDDGDGILNAADCAPLDNRLATLHTYYLDLDLDQYGDRTAGFVLCTTSPPPLLSAWGEDTNDYDIHDVPEMVQKGDRLLGIDFGRGAENSPLQLDMARELGADATVVSLYWSLIESAPSEFNGPQAALLGLADLLFGPEGLAVSLTLSPIVGSHIVVPADLRSGLVSGELAFNDPAVVARFTGLLDHVHARLGGVELVSLQIGQDVDLYHPRTPGPQFWDEYREFLIAVAAYARSIWGEELRVGVTSTHRGLLDEPTRTVMRNLNAHADQVNVTLNPRNPDFSVVSPEAVYADLQELLALYDTEDIAFQSVTFPSSVQALSSETMQSQSLRAFLDIWDRNAERIPFASFGRLNDLPGDAIDAELDLLDAPPGDVAPAYAGSTGLRGFDGDGAAKAAYKTLRNYAFQRGWWRVPAPTERSFHMGFTVGRYDHSLDPDIYQEVKDWMNARLDSHSDIVAIHLDSGVPWVEAYADDFTSFIPPYSNDVFLTWRDLRENTPDDSKLVVAINPTGVPRSRLAPYWGYGEGFTYDIEDRFRPIPNGIFEDTNRRMLPAPWDTYNFDSPEVKLAFLKYCLRAIQFFEPDYLVVAIEASVVLTEEPEQYPRWLELQRFLYEALKSIPLSQDIPIGISVSATSLPADEYGVAIKAEQMEPGRLELQREGFLQAAEFVDFMGLSFYPHDGKYYGHQLLASSFDDILDLVEQTGKPFAITESGFLAEPIALAGFPFPMNEEKQRRYFKWMLYEVRKRNIPFEFFVNFFIRDNDQAWVQTSEDVPLLFSEFYKFFRDTGIFDGEGNPRPAEEVWLHSVEIPYAPRDGGL